MTAEDRENREPGMISAAQAAKLLMLTPRRLRQLADDGHIPKAVRGRYPLPGLVRGYLTFLRERIERAGQNAGAGLADAKAHEVRLRTRQREAELIDAEDAQRFHAFSSKLYRETLAGLGASVTRDPILAATINAPIKAALDRFDARFADALPKLKRGDDPLA